MSNCCHESITFFIERKRRDWAYVTSCNPSIQTVLGFHLPRCCAIIWKHAIVIEKKDYNRNNNKKYLYIFLYHPPKIGITLQTINQKSLVIVGQRGRVIFYHNLWLGMTLFYILVLYMEAHRVRHAVPPCLFHCSLVHHFP